MAQQQPADIPALKAEHAVLSTNQTDMEKRLEQAWEELGKVMMKISDAPSGSKEIPQLEEQKNGVEGKLKELEESVAAATILTNAKQAQIDFAQGREASE